MIQKYIHLKMADEKDFCTELREKTKNVHDVSDKLINVKLAIALTDLKTYGHVLADFYFVFQHIENALEEAKSHPYVKPLIFHQLARVKSFEEDLCFYLGDDWSQKVQPSTPAKEYCERIMDVTRNDPYLLIAYAHSMYLALLAGGQMIKKIVRKTLGLSSEEGLAIFRFPEGKHEVRKQFMDNINAMDLSRDQKDMIIQEKMRIFQMNNAIASTVKASFSSSRRLIKMILIIVVLWLFLFYLFCKFAGLI